METMTVTNAARLISVLKSARGGETILMAPGNHGDVSLCSIRPSTTITIRLADPDNDAMFTSLKHTRANNLAFEDIDVTHVLALGERDFESAIRVNSSSNINLVGIDLSGSRNGNPLDDGNGLFVHSSSRIAVLDSTFHKFKNAAVFHKTNNVVFAGNSIYDAREGVNAAEVNGGPFERNSMTGNRPNVGTGVINFSAPGVRAGSVAAIAGAGFQAVAGIGNLAGTAAAHPASYLPRFDGQFTAAYPL
jgi:hypothetical protein